MEKKRPFFIPLALIMLITPWVTAGCHEQRGGYIAASSISQNGFAINGDEMRAVQGQEIRVWGFVDHSNLYGDDGAKKILGEWWSGDGPNAASWRFNLKAKEEIDQLSPDFVAFRRTLGSAPVHLFTPEIQHPRAASGRRDMDLGIARLAADHAEFALGRAFRVGTDRTGH